MIGTQRGQNRWRSTLTSLVCYILSLIEIMSIISV